MATPRLDFGLGSDEEEEAACESGKGEKIVGGGGVGERRGEGGGLMRGRGGMGWGLTCGPWEVGPWSQWGCG